MAHEMAAAAAAATPDATQSEERKAADDPNDHRSGDGRTKTTKWSESRHQKDARPDAHIDGRHNDAQPDRHPADPADPNDDRHAGRNDAEEEEDEEKRMMKKAEWRTTKADPPSP